MNSGHFHGSALTPLHSSSSGLQDSGGFASKAAGQSGEHSRQGANEVPAPYRLVGGSAHDVGGELSSEAGTSRSGESVEPNSKLAAELLRFNQVAANLRRTFMPRKTFEERCEQAFDLANDLFGNAPTWICFYRELMGGGGFIPLLFDNNDEYGRFLRTEQYHQIQLMLTALRSRELPENDPNDPQRMITVRLPKSLHEAMCDEAGRLNISVNRLCISRMLQLLDPKMIPETNSKPRGRKPRTRLKSAPVAPSQPE